MINLSVVLCYLKISATLISNISVPLRNLGITQINVTSTSMLLTFDVLLKRRGIHIQNVTLSLTLFDTMRKITIE